MSVTAQNPAASDHFDCKGGTTTEIFLKLSLSSAPILSMNNALAENTNTAFTRPASNPDHFAASIPAEIRQAAIISSQLASLSEQFASPMEAEISHSLEFIESIQAKFKEIGTSAAKNNRDTLSGMASPLIQKAGDLTTQMMALINELGRAREEYEDIKPRLLTPPHTGEHIPQLDPIKSSMTRIEKQITQLHLDQEELTKSLKSVENAGIHLLPDTIKAPFIARQGERRGGPGS